jgi:hypothetical protein
LGGTIVTVNILKKIIDMSRTPNFDAKIKSLLAATKPGERVCELTGEKWMMTEEEISWYRKFNVPPSKRSPLTRLKQLAANFTIFQWWYHKHPSGKQVLSGLNPNSGIKAIPDKEWFDSDFSSITSNFDPAKPFFDQFRTLQVQVPVNASRNLIEPENSIALTSLGDINSYLVMASSMKNGFLSIDAFDCEDSGLVAFCDKTNGCYDAALCNRIHNCTYARHSNDCVECTFVFDCRNCEFCFGATNKRNRKYLWFNEQLSEKEWKRRRTEVDLGNRRQFDAFKQQFEQLMRDQTVWPENFNEKAENCVGEYLWDVTDAHETYFSLKNSRDLFHVFVSFNEAQRMAFVGGSILCSDMFGSVVNSRSSNCRYVYAMVGCQNMEYSMNCFNCENCFGCIGLQRKKFCIFNKQYSEEDFWKKVDEIKSAMLDRGEYGECFPAYFAASYFYESGAAVLFGCDKTDAQQLGVADYDPNANGASGYGEVDPNAKQTSEIPASLADINVEDWAGKPIFDPAINRQFSFLKPELEFYHKKRIAPPKEHFITRMITLLKQMNSAIFENQACAKCSKEIRVAKCFGYPERTIFCKSCYLQYIEQNG